MKDTGLRNPPLDDFAQNQLWIAVVMLATELTAWMQMLALAGTDARTWEPKRLRLRLFSIAGSIAHHSRRTWLHLSAHAPHVNLITTGLTRLQGLPQVTRPGKTTPRPAPNPHRAVEPGAQPGDTGVTDLPRHQKGDRR